MNTTRLSQGANVFFMLFTAAFMIAGCGDIDTGGNDGSGSLFIVGNIDPIYLGDSTWNVDINQNTCVGGDEGPEPEDFTDHVAVAELVNRPPPQATEQTATTIRLYRYEIRYTPASSPAPPGPSVPSIVEYKSVDIPPCVPGDVSCEGTEVSVVFVPIQKKLFIQANYPGAGLDLVLDQRAYAAEYTFFGENDYGEEVRAVGYVNFNVLDFCNCSTGGCL